MVTRMAFFSALRCMLPQDLSLRITDREHILAIRGTHQNQAILVWLR